MGRERGYSFIIAVLIVIILFASGSADAGSLLAVGGPDAPKPALREQPGLLDQGVSWLADLWSDVMALFAADTAGSGPVIQTCPPETPNCGDAGPGIDPEG